MKQRTNKRPRRAHARRGGFTLLEVLLVLAILGVIMAMVVPQLLGRQQEAMIKAAALNIKGFEDAVKLYAADHDGEYPQGTSEDVVPLLLSAEDLETGKPRAPYLENIPLDPWDNPLMYEYPATGNRQTLSGKPAIWSIGPDKQDGTDDDIDNWEQKQF